jgi:uncharacterized protein with PQ loop repeat
MKRTANKNTYHSILSFFASFIYNFYFYLFYGKIIKFINYHLIKKPLIKCEAKNTEKEQSRNRIQYIRNASKRVQ